MIKTYQYIHTDHSKLHEFVMAFFTRIEHETGDFDDTFFDPAFLSNIVNHHPRILKDKFKSIYNQIKDWQQPIKTAFIQSIKDSNSIKEICEGLATPTKTDTIDSTIREDIKTLFKTLYEEILKGSKHYKTHYGSLLDHFKALRSNTDNNFEYCPTCGLVELKTEYDETRNQYDHYLAKDIYPFSAINFYNLVPICTDCNGLDNKSNKDTLHHGKAFFPYDPTHQGIDIAIAIDDPNQSDLTAIKWNILYTQNGTETQEITTWKYLYNIETRYQNYVKGRVMNWYKHYHEFFYDKDTIEDIPDEQRRKNNYLRNKKSDKIIKYQTLTTLLNSNIEAARQAANEYSLY